MKKKVLLSLAGLTCLVVGFGLFLARFYGIALILTIVGIFVYLYKKIKNAD